jgi:tRNA-dihydrouridine synthase
MLYRTIQYLTNGELPPEPTGKEKIRIAILHMDRLIALKGEHIAVKEMRKHLAWYLKGLQGGARVRDIVMEQTKRDAMAEVLEQFVSSLSESDSSEDAPFMPQLV